MDNRMCMFEDEKEISLFGLMAYAMRKWKLLVLLLLIGAVLFVGVYAVRQPSAAELLAQEEALRAKMDALYEDIGETQSAYDNLKAYRKDSIYINLDASNVFCGELQYFVANGAETAYTAQMLKASLQSADVLARIGEAIEADSEERYIRELVTFDMESMSAAGSAGSAEGYLVTAKVIGKDENFCNAALAVLKDEADRIAGFSAQGIIRLTVEDSYVYRNSKIELVRDSVDQRITTLESSLTKLKTGLTAEELAYFDAEYLKVENVSKPNLFAGGINTVDLIKWAAIGMVCAFMGWACVFGLKYLASDWISSAEEFKGAGIPLIAFVKKEQSGKKDLICTLADKMEYACDLPVNDEAYVRACIETMGQGKLVMLGDEKCCAQIGKICQGLENVQMVGEITSDSAALTAAQNADGVIVLFEKNRSKHGKIKRELEVCAMHGIKVLGTIVIG